MADIITDIDNSITSLLFSAAKHIISKQVVIDSITKMVDSYTETLKQRNKPALPAQPKLITPVIPDSHDPYVNKFNQMVINPGKLFTITGVAKRIIAGKDQYDIIEAKTKVPWWWTGITHYREGDLNFGTYLGNGQSLHHRTTITPKGQGPFDSFLDGALNALKLQGLSNLADWPLGKALFRWEAYNGLGYRKKGLPSPYLWAGSNQYSHGKYVADGVFDSNAVDQQLGCATILKVLSTLTPIEFKF